MFDLTIGGQRFRHWGREVDYLIGRIGDTTNPAGREYANFCSHDISLCL